MYTHLEDYINNLYNMIGISKPSELDMHLIAERLGVKIIYWRYNFRLGDEIILSPDTRQKQWQNFGHELCHYLIHYGHQLSMNYLFRDLQEYQSNHFAYHFCVPTFMLDQLKGVTAYDIASLFNVEYGFALYRLEMYKNKFYERRIFYAMQ